jgi:hypothetical protein
MKFDSLIRHGDCLGVTARDQTPYDRLKPVVITIIGFSLGTPDGGRCAMRLETI